VTSPLKTWVDRDGGLLRLRLARPKANILDAEMLAAVAAALAPHREPGRVRAALVDHEGPHFSFGASVEEHLPAQCAAMLEGLHSLLIAMLEWPRPILFAVSGQCLGGGLEFALAGSRMVVSPDAQLGQPEMRLGVFAPAASALLPFRVNQATAEDLLLAGRSVGAAEALSLGIAQAIADDPAAALLEYFDQHLAPKSASSIGFAVRAARAGMIDEAKRRIAAVEKLYLEGLMATHDAVEGLEAFLAKRAAAWRHA
jgi:cyclohexa-1,5-dienecarbonyl-CoA hydratase